MNKSSRTVLKEIYLEYVNDYLSPDKYADHNGLTPKQANLLINIARDVYNSKHPQE